MFHCYNVKWPRGRPGFDFRTMQVRFVLSRCTIDSFIRIQTFSNMIYKYFLKYITIFVQSTEISAR